MNPLNIAEIEQQVCNVICDVTGLKIDGIRKDANLYTDIGIDSIKGIELTVALQEKFSIQIDDSKIRDLTSVVLIAGEVSRLLSKPQSY